MIDQLESTHGLEIPTTAIGQKILENLKRIDAIAYIRFASVYKDFRNLEEFLDEITEINSDYPQ
tara:strand:+ start:882 stop:1073 length:192 start_codon:yes stop_codon:yes gene_type:complete